MDAVVVELFFFATFYQLIHYCSSILLSDNDIISVVTNNTCREHQINL